MASFFSGLKKKKAKPPRGKDPAPVVSADDPSCTLMIMRKGRSLDERMMAEAVPRRRVLRERKKKLKDYRAASMSNVLNLTDIASPLAAQKNASKKDSKRAMRESTVRGINHMLRTSSLSMPVISEIYISAAAAVGNVRELERLGKLGGSNIDAADSKGRSAVHVSAQEGQLESLRALKDLGANINAQDKLGATGAYLAAARGNVQVLYVLEELGADLEIATFDGATPAYIAAFHGHIEVLQALYDLATDVDHPMPDGATPTFIAAANGQVEVLRTLYELEADMNRSTMDGATPAFIAAQEGEHEVLRVLGNELEANVDFPDEDGATPACIAAQEGQIECLRVLSELGADLNIATKHGANPACIAAKRGSSVTLAVLGELGADLDAPTRNFVPTRGSKSPSDSPSHKSSSKNLTQVAPAHIAAFCGHCDVLKMLGQLGANVEAQEEHGATPIFVAAANDKIQSIACLAIDLGCDLDLCTYDGIAPVHIAAANDQVGSLRCLHDLGANIDAVTSEGITAAVIAAKNENLPSLKMLLERGASLPETAAVVVANVLSLNEELRSLLGAEQRADLRRSYLNRTPLVLWHNNDLSDYLVLTLDLDLPGCPRHNGSTIEAKDPSQGARSTATAHDDDDSSYDEDEEIDSYDYDGGEFDGGADDASYNGNGDDSRLKQPNGAAVISALRQYHHSPVGSGNGTQISALEEVLRPLFIKEKVSVAGGSGSEDEKEEGDDEEKIEGSVLSTCYERLSSIYRASPVWVRLADTYGVALQRGCALYDSPEAFAARRPQERRHLEDAGPLSQRRKRRNEAERQNYVLLLSDPFLSSAGGVSQPDSASDRDGVANTEADPRGDSPMLVCIVDTVAFVRVAEPLSETAVMTWVAKDDIIIDTVALDNGITGSDGGSDCRSVIVGQQWLGDSLEDIAQGITAALSEENWARCTLLLTVISSAIHRSHWEILSVRSTQSSPVEVNFQQPGLAMLSTGLFKSPGSEATCRAIASALIAVDHDTSWAALRTTLGLLVDADVANEYFVHSSMSEAATGMSSSSSFSHGKLANMGSGAGRLKRQLSMKPLANNEGGGHGTGGANDGNTMFALALRRLGNNPSPLVPWLLSVANLGRAGYTELSTVVRSIEPFGLRAAHVTNGEAASVNHIGATIPDPTVQLPSEGDQESATDSSKLSMTEHMVSRGDRHTPVLVAVLRGALRRGDDAYTAIKTLCVAPVQPADGPSESGKAANLVAHDCRLAQLLLSWIQGASEPKEIISNGGRASSCNLVELWRQAIEFHETGPRKLPVGHIYVILSSKPSPSSSSTAKSESPLHGNHMSAGKSGTRYFDFTALLSLDDAAGIILNANACRRVVSDPWWCMMPPIDQSSLVRNNSSSRNLNIGTHRGGRGGSENICSGGDIGSGGRVYTAASCSVLCLVERLHLSAWRLLQTAKGEGGSGDSHGGYEDDAMTVLLGALEDEASFRIAIHEIDRLGENKASTSSDPEGHISQRSNSIRRGRSAALLPMPPAPAPSLVTEEELREDEEARWMAHDKTSPSLADIEVRRVRQEACRSLLHSHTALALREALLPSRSTPGLWQSIDQCGLAAADRRLAEVLAKPHNLRVDLEPRMTEALIAFLKAVLKAVSFTSRPMGELQSDFGATLLDADVMKDEIVAAAVEWLCGGNSGVSDSKSGHSSGLSEPGAENVRSNLISIFNHEIAEYAAAVDDVSHRLSATMQKVVQVATSAASFLSKMPIAGGDGVDGAGGGGTARRGPAGSMLSRSMSLGRGAPGSGIRRGASFSEHVPGRRRDLPALRPIASAVELLLGRDREHSSSDGDATSADEMRCRHMQNNPGGNSGGSLEDIKEGGIDEDEADDGSDHASRIVGCPLVSSHDLTDLLIAAMEMDATAHDVESDNGGSSDDGVNPLPTLQTRNNAPASSKTASQSSNAGASQPPIITSNSYLSGYYESLERSKQATLRSVDQSVASVARRTAERVTGRVEQRLSSAAEKLSLHVRACRSVIETLRGLDLRLVRSQHAASGQLRRRAVKLLVRVLATRWREGDGDGNDDDEWNGDGQGNTGSVSAQSKLQRASSESLAAGSSPFASKWSRMGAHGAGAGGNDGTDRLRSSQKNGNPGGGMSDFLASVLSLAPRYNFEASAEKIFPKVFEDPSVPSMVGDRMTNPFDSEVRSDGSLFVEESEADARREAVVVDAARRFTQQPRDTAGNMRRNKEFQLKEAVHSIGRGRDGRAPQALRRLTTSATHHDDEGVAEGEKDEELDRSFRLALAELSSLMYSRYDDNLDDQIEGSRGPPPVLSKCKLPGGYTATALHYSSPEANDNFSRRSRPARRLRQSTTSSKSSSGRSSFVNGDDIKHGEHGDIPRTEHNDTDEDDENKDDKSVPGEPITWGLFELRHYRASKGSAAGAALVVAFGSGSDADLDEVAQSQRPQGSWLVDLFAGRDEVTLLSEYQGKPTESGSRLESYSPDLNDEGTKARSDTDASFMASAVSSFGGSGPGSSLLAPFFTCPEPSAIATTQALGCPESSNDGDGYHGDETTERERRGGEANIEKDEVDAFTADLLAKAALSLPELRVNAGWFNNLAQVFGSIARAVTAAVIASGRGAGGDFSSINSSGSFDPRDDQVPHASSKHPSSSSSKSNSSRLHDVWVTGHGLGGAYAQLLQLLLLASGEDQGADNAPSNADDLSESSPWRPPSPSTQSSYSGHSGSHWSSQNRSSFAASTMPGTQISQTEAAVTAIVETVGCVCFGAPQVVQCDRSGGVAQLLKRRRSMLLCFIFGHDLVPRILSGLHSTMDESQLTSHQQLQLRRIELQYSKAFRSMLCAGSGGGALQYIPFGHYYFIHPSLGLHGRPLRQWDCDPAKTLSGARLLRRLDVSWAVLPLFMQLHDVHTSYCGGMRSAAGVPLLLHDEDGDRSSTSIVRFLGSSAHDPYSTAIASAVAAAGASALGRSSNSASSPSSLSFMTAQRRQQQRLQRQQEKEQQREKERQHQRQEEEHLNKEHQEKNEKKEPLSRRFGSNQRPQSFEEPPLDPKGRGANRNKPSSFSTGDEINSRPVSATFNGRVAPGSNRSDDDDDQTIKKYSRRSKAQNMPKRSVSFREEEVEYYEKARTKDNDEGDSDADGADDDVINQQDKSDQLTAFLALAKLSHVEDRLREEGYEEIDDFTDATDADLKECGFKKPEIKRLRRYLTSPTKNK